MRQQDFFHISPRPFTVQPNANHGFQFVNPALAGPAQSQQQVTLNNNDGPNRQFPFTQSQRPQLTQPADNVDQFRQTPLHQVLYTYIKLNALKFIQLVLRVFLFG